MKTFQCLVVDDEPLAIEVIESFISKLDYLNLAGTCHNAFGALNTLKSMKIDILFVDIQMPKLTGLELIRMLDKPPKIIMTTAYKEFAIDTFDLEVEIADYLLKPISFERFMKAVNKVTGDNSAPDMTKSTDSENAENFIFIKSDKQMRKIILNDIYYIEGLNDYIKIITRNGIFISYLTLKYMEAKLPEHQFFRAHRSFIINVNNIESYSQSNITINKTKLPIGRHYKKSIIDLLDDYASKDNR